MHQPPRFDSFWTMNKLGCNLQYDQIWIIPPKTYVNTCTTISILLAGMSLGAMILNQPAANMTRHMPSCSKIVGLVFCWIDPWRIQDQQRPAGHYLNRCSCLDKIIRTRTDEIGSSKVRAICIPHGLRYVAFFRTMSPWKTHTFVAAACEILVTHMELPFIRGHL